MNDQQLNASNIDNLTQLWTLMGAKPCIIEGGEKIFISDSWPHRHWPEGKFVADNTATVDDIISRVRPDGIIPVWQQPDNRLEKILSSNGFSLSFEQTAMTLDLQGYVLEGSSDLVIKNAVTAQDIALWTETESKIFGYDIDLAVIEKIAGHPDIQLLMAYQPADGEAGTGPLVATALIFNSNNVIGMHQGGVLPAYRRQNIARQLLVDTIEHCSRSTTRYLTLQASAAAENLYASFGFKKQFKIKNYRH